MSIVIDGSVGISSIGTLTGVTSISSAAADTPVILQDSSSNSNTCRAWVNFNGTSTVAIRADFNVTSITDNGTGDYTVNFTNAMPDANYSFVATSGSGGWVTRIVSMAAGNCNIQTIVGNTTTATDTTFVNVAIFR